MKVSMETMVAALTSSHGEDSDRDGATFRLQWDDRESTAADVTITADAGQTIRLRVNKAEANELVFAFESMADALRAQA